MRDAAAKERPGRQRGPRRSRTTRASPARSLPGRGRRRRRKAERGTGTDRKHPSSDPLPNAAAPWNTVPGPLPSALTSGRARDGEQLPHGPGSPESRPTRGGLTAADRRARPQLLQAAWAPERARSRELGRLGRGGISRSETWAPRRLLVVKERNSAICIEMYCIGL